MIIAYNNVANRTLVESYCYAEYLTILTYYSNTNIKQKYFPNFVIVLIIWRRIIREIILENRLEIWINFR